MSKEVKAINKMIRTSSQKLNLIVKDIRKKDINAALNILNKLPISASNLYSKNMFNFVENLFDKENKKININLEDEIINKTMVK